MPTNVCSPFSLRRSGVCTLIGLGLFLLPFPSLSFGAPQQGEKSAPLDAEVQRLRKAYTQAESNQNFAGMEDCVRRILEIAQARQDFNLLARYHNVMGQSLWMHGDALGRETPAAKSLYLRAIQEYEESLRWMPRMTDMPMQVAIGIQSNLGAADTLLRLNENTPAILRYERCIELATKAGDVRDLPQWLKNLGSIPGNKQEIAGFLEMQRSIFEQKQWGECAAWCDYFVAFTHRPFDSIVILKNVVAQAAGFDPKEESDVRGSALQYLGLLYNEVENFEAADSVCDQADKIWAKRFAGDPNGCAQDQAECRNNRARALLNLGEFKAALEELDSALRLKKFIPKFEERDAIESNKRLAEQCLLSLKGARITPESARHLLTLPGQSLVRAAMALRLAEELRGAGLPDQEILQMAQAALEKELTSLPPQPTSPSGGLKRLFLGALVLERKLPLQAVPIIEHARKDLEATQNENALTFCLPLLAVAQSQTGQAQNAEATFKQAVERFEARLAQITTPERMGLFQLAQANTLYADYADFLARTNRPEEALLMADRGRARGMARQALQVMAAANVAESERQFKGRLWIEPLNSLELQKLIRTRPDTLFLHYHVGRDSVTLIATGDHVAVHSFLLKQNYPALMRQVDTWIQNISHGGLIEREASLARDLGKSLLDPLYTSGLLSANNKKSLWRRLVIVPDGGLHNLPFAALSLPEPGTPRLIERFPYSISLSLRQLARPLPLRKPRGGMLVVADPTGGRKITGDTPHASLQGSPLDPPLPAARDFARKIRQVYAGDILPLIGVQATKPTVLRLLPNYGVLVFDTHGHPREGRNGLDSYLTLAPKEGGGADDLQASDILTSPLSAHLTMLIACETAQGMFAGGEGNQGLIWGFGAAGCPNVVASLWKVNPARANDLLAFFLQANQKLPGDRALQKAILKVRSKYPHPSDWAAFQVYGDPIPLLELTQRPSH